MFFIIDYIDNLIHGKKKGERCNHEKVKLLFIHAVTNEPLDGFCEECKSKVKRAWIIDET